MKTGLNDIARPYDDRLGGTDQLEIEAIDVAVYFRYA